MGGLQKLLTFLLARPARSEDEYFPGFFTSIELEDFFEIYWRFCEYCRVSWFTILECSNQNHRIFHFWNKFQTRISPDCPSKSFQTQAIFLTYSQPGPSFINLFVQYSQSDLPPLRPLCGEAPGRDSNPGRADLVAGTLTTRPPHLTGIKHYVSNQEMFQKR